MHIQNMVKFYQFVLKILSGNENLTDGRNDRESKSSIVPLFQSGAINSLVNCYDVFDKLVTTGFHIFRNACDADILQ